MNMRSAFRHAALVAAAYGGVVVGASSLRGETVGSWASAVSGNWSTPALWTSNPNYPSNDQPNFGDTYSAVIDALGPSYTVSLDAPVTINNLTMVSPAATLSHTNGTLTILNGAVVNAGTYQLSGGALAGSGPMLVASHLDWDSGTMSGFGTTTIAQGGVLTLGPTAGLRVLNRVLQNAGTTNFTGGTVAMSTATFSNLASGVLNISSSNNFTNMLGTNTLANQGTINVGVAGSNTFIFSPRLINSGTLVCNAGTLFFNAPITQSGGAYVTGPGFINFSNAQTLADGVTTWAGTGIHFSGQLTGPGDLMIGNTFTWTSGNIGGTGLMTIPAGVTVNSGTTSGRLELDRILNNSGTINVTNSSFLVGYGTFGTLNNLAGGVINLGTNTVLGGGFAPSTINNTGVINVNAGSVGLATFTSNNSQSFINSGTISVNSGTLFFSTATFTHNNGSRLAGAGTVLLGGSLTVGRQIIAGNVDWSVANVSLNSGTIINNGQLSIDGTLNVNGSTLTGNGTYQINGTMNWNGGTIGFPFPPTPSLPHVEIASGATLNMANSIGRTLSGTIDNAGVANFTGGSLTLQSGTFHNLAGGVLNLSVRTSNFAPTFSPTGLVVNDGTMNVNGSGIGSVVFSVPFTNTGTINVTGGTLTFYNHNALVAGTINGFAESDLDLVMGSAHIDGFDGVGSLTIQDSATVSAAHVHQGRIGIGAGATVQIRPNGGNEGTSRTSLPVFGAGATFDVTNNSLIVNYNGPDPIADVRQAIIDGKIVSSLTDATHRLGVADNAVLNLSSFGGQNNVFNTVLVKYTFTGDSNLDGAVDVTDLGALATHWQGTGGWTDGDFNYDGFVDVSDLGILATNWQRGGASFQDALISVGLSDHAVPEPGALAGAVGLALAKLCHRRRGRRRHRAGRFAGAL
jgi:hypothetical protein